MIEGNARRRATRGHAARLAARLAAGLLGLACTWARAEDIDIYSMPPGSDDLPNVLIVLDNSANWASNLAHGCRYRDNGVPTGRGPKETDKRLGMEKCALYNLIDALPVAGKDKGRYRIGLMLFAPRGSASDAGYPKIAFTEVTGDGKVGLKARIDGLDDRTDGANNAPLARSFHEAYLYFAGMTPRAGNIPQADPQAFVGGLYRSPAAASCSRNYLVFIGNGMDPTPDRQIAPGLLQALGGDTRQIAYASDVGNLDENLADEYARFMANRDVSSKEGAQAITTYTIGVSDGMQNAPALRYRNYLSGMAWHGGGRFFEADGLARLEESLLTIFEQIAEVDSAFVSASLPVSVNSRGTYLNQVYMGLFRPDVEPRWRGNLKRYRFEYDVVNDALYLSDTQGAPAISPATGFFAPSAVSFWTSDSSFWVNQPMGTPPSASDLPDGEVVEKGGAAQRLRERFDSSPGERVIYTCMGCAPGTSLAASTATRFETANGALTQEKLRPISAGATQIDRNALIDWVRGVDNAGDERGPGGATLVRPSVHGDVLHSRPVAVNYGGDAEKVAVFYGANDGMLHAIDGTTGEPYWSFVPEESFPKLQRLRDNAPTIRFPGTLDSATTPRPRDYFVDGPLSFYQRIGPDGASEKVHLYVGLRRGGRALYGFDVTDPRAPRFLWKKSNADIPVLGQTWSEARVARLRGHANPVLVMGAGYDPGAEDGSSPGAVTMGNAVLVLDAITGDLLGQFPTGRPVVADVSLVDTDYDGYVDRGYAADLGGTVHRIDFEKDDPASGVLTTKEHWAMARFAVLGASAGTSGDALPAGSRKIFHAPDVVLTRDYAIVLVGTGDREKPLAELTDERFFTLIDREKGKGIAEGFQPITHDELVAQALFEPASAGRGCFVEMDARGEKVVNAPVTAGGVTYFSTNRPTMASPNACNDTLGEAKVYGVPLVCGVPKSQVLIGGGLPPSPVAGTVAITLGTTADGSPIVRRVPFLIGGLNPRRSGIEGSKVQIAVTPRRQRIYWFNETER